MGNLREAAKMKNESDVKGHPLLSSYNNRDLKMSTLRVKDHREVKSQYSMVRDLGGRQFWSKREVWVRQSVKKV